MNHPACSILCHQQWFHSLVRMLLKKRCFTLYLREIAGETARGKGPSVLFPLQKFSFGILGKKHTGVPSWEEAAAIKAKTEECNGVSQAEFVSLWGRAAGCWLCSGSMVRHSLEIKKHSFWKFLMKVLFNRKYWDWPSGSFCKKWLLVLGNVIFH